MTNSFHVKQFVALARGEIKPQKPTIKDKLNSVCQVDGLCLKCNLPGTFDEIRFVDGTVWKVCQTCSNVLINGIDSHRILAADGHLYRREEI